MVFVLYHTIKQKGAHLFFIRSSTYKLIYLCIRNWLGKYFEKKKKSPTMVKI